jgi:hypothetical protein
MVDGWDSPSLATLEGLDVGGSLSGFEAIEYLRRAVRELGLVFPDDEAALRRRLSELVCQIRRGATDPEMGVDLIHREVVSSFGHPPDPMPWGFLSEGDYPDETGMTPDSELIPTIAQFAERWESGKGAG